MSTQSVDRVIPIAHTPLSVHNDNRWIASRDNRWIASSHVEPPLDVDRPRWCETLLGVVSHPVHRTLREGAVEGGLRSDLVEEVSEREERALIAHHDGIEGLGVGHAVGA